MFEYVCEKWRSELTSSVVNAIHLRSTFDGWVTGVGRPLRTGRTTHVWQVGLTNDSGQLTCVSRITMAILAPTK